MGPTCRSVDPRSSMPSNAPPMKEERREVVRDLELPDLLDEEERTVFSQSLVPMPPGVDHRVGAPRPTTVHGYVQQGDLVGLQKKLLENPSLLNERNEIVRSPFCSSLLCWLPSIWGMSDDAKLDFSRFILILVIVSQRVRFFLRFDILSNPPRNAFIA